MRIILLGAPGSGKGTQSEFIMNRYGVPQISIGKILRDIIQKKTRLSLLVKKFVDIGELVPDHIIIDMVYRYICQHGYYKRFLLDGFPRTLGQAIAMKKKGIMVDIVLELISSDTLIIERIVGRRIHEPSGRVYHIKFNPPKYDNYDDYTGEKLIIREDDQEHIILRRLILYRKHTFPVIQYYLQEAKMGCVHYFSINGNCKIDDVHQKLIRILG